MHNLTVSNFELTPTGLQSVGIPTFEQWVDCGKFIRQANGAVHFWIGDWLNFGEQRYGEMYAQALDQTNYDYQTLSDDKWVASKVELSRRHENLSFDHHRAVASLEPIQQSELLIKAENENIPTKEFRRVVREFRIRIDLPELTDEQFKQLSTPHDDFNRVQEIVDASITMLEKLDALDLNTIDIDAKAYLLSHLKKSVGIIGKTIIQYEK